MSREDERGSPVAASVIALVLATALGLTGCGSQEPDAAATTPKPGSARPKGPGDMVAAVSSSKAPGPVDLRFSLSGRPAVGQPLEIRLALTPAVELDRLFARFQASDGLTLMKGAETQHYERPVIGTGLSHIVTVVPNSDGIYNVTATVLSDSPTDSIARIYTIPIIAGSGLAELPAAPAARPQSKPTRP